jgi:hypothetical protein
LSESECKGHAAVVRKSKSETNSEFINRLRVPMRKLIGTLVTFSVWSFAHADFSPPQAGHVVFWAEADAGVETNGQGRVALWKDHSGRSNDAIQSEPERQPGWTPTALGGHPVLTFDGTNDLLRTKAWAIGRVTGLTVFVVGRHAGALNESAFVAACDGPTYSAMYTAHHDWFILRALHGSNNARVSERAEMVDLNGPKADQQFHLFSMVFAGRDSVTSAVDGHVIQSVKTSIRSLVLASAVDIGGLGDGVPPNPCFPVQIAALVIYNTSLSAADRAIVEQQLLTKYGLSTVRK